MIDLIPVTWTLENGKAQVGTVWGIQGNIIHNHKSSTVIGPVGIKSDSLASEDLSITPPHGRDRIAYSLLHNQLFPG